MTRHNRTDPAEEQAAESARSRELFMPVSLLRGPGEANHRESVMTSHLPDGKPGSVAPDIGSPDMTKRNRDLEHRGPAAGNPRAHRHRGSPVGPGAPDLPRAAAAWPASSRRAGWPRSTTAPPSSPGPASQACAYAAHQEFTHTGHTPSHAAGTAAARKDPEEQSAQLGGARRHRARFVRPLDSGSPYGCRGQGRAL